jgi:hypothetical protein
MSIEPSPLPLFISRYVDLPELFDLVKNSRLVLRDPLSWEDKNDYFLIRQYLNEKNQANDVVKNIFALCFTSEHNAYHFWKMYSTKTAGVCIRFSTEKILELIKNDRDAELFRLEHVKYKAMSDVRNEHIPIKEYPFIKRIAFQSEREVRLIFESHHEIPSRHLSISSDCIKEILLSPSMPEDYVSVISDIVTSLQGSNIIKPRKSRILDSRDWKMQLIY